LFLTPGNNLTQTHADSPQTMFWFNFSEVALL